MYGAILGDIIGAPYEFHPHIKTKAFPLLQPVNTAEGAYAFTDDSVMTVAVADALLQLEDFHSEDVKYGIINSMQYWGGRYPDAGYGDSFFKWLVEPDPEPYNSFGNGAAMRVSPAGWLYRDLYQTRLMARLTAEVSHNHIEGLKGAESVASAIFLARSGATKTEIRDYIVREFGYDLSPTYEQIRPSYRYDVTCQGTVPAALISFLEGDGFEDTVRNAVFLCGDADTLGCIAGSIAEAYYGIPDDLIVECRKRLPNEILSVLDAFYSCIHSESGDH